MICPNCSTQFEEEAKFCNYCGTNLGDSAKAQGMVKQVMQSVYQPRKELRAGNRKKWHILLPVAGILFTTVILTLLLYPYPKKASEGFVYLRDGYFYYKPVKSGPAIKLTKDIYDSNQEDQYFEFRMNFMIKFNEKGSRVFFPGEISELNGDIDLYYLDLQKKGSKSEKVAKSIWNYEINEAGTRVYYLNSENELYESNLKDGDKIADDVSYFVSSKDGSRLIWFNNENQLFYKSEAEDKDKLDHITEFVYCTPDLKKLYYLKGDELFLSVDGKKGEKILSGVSEVLKVYETGEIYYCQRSMEDRKLSELVEDDMLEADRNMTEPIPQIYPSYDDYRPDSPAPEEPDWYAYTDRNGMTDREDYQKDYDVFTEKIKSYNTDWDRRYQAALEQYYLEYDTFNAAELLYGKKKERDSLREALNQETFVQTHGTLYFYDTKASVIVSDAFKSVISTGDEHPAIVYCNQYNERIEKKKLSEITDLSEVSAPGDGQDRTSMKLFAAIGVVASGIKQEQGDYFQFDTSLTYLYYMDHYDPGNGSGELIRVPIKNSGLGIPETYDSGITFYQILKGRDTVLYFKNAEDSYGDLYLDKNRIDKDVRFKLLIPSEEGNGFYYLTEYNSDTLAGTLMYYDGMDTTEVSEDVYDYYVINDKSILYMKNYDRNNGSGDLFLYDGQETEIDEKVSMLLKHDKYYEYYLDDHYLVE